MATTIGIVLSDRISTGLVRDGVLVGPLRLYPAQADDDTSLVELHTEALVETVCRQVIEVAGKLTDISAIGVAVPGIIRSGVVEDSPNLPQLKGARIETLLTAKLAEHGLHVPLCVLNDADGMAAGLAATMGKLQTFLRVWTLGVGIGYGRYPYSHGVWEGGHTTVTLDEKENFCGCGGRGHIEGIMGHRAMRLRFLDLEPEEVFAEARGKGKDAKRCRDFVKLWHRALAAGIATSIHMEGPGRFLLTGFNVRFVDLPLLKSMVNDMVKMSPVQSYALEVVEDNLETRVIGSGVAAEQGTSA